MRVAVDIMGGDLAPASAITGARLAVEKNRDLTTILVGDWENIDQHFMAEAQHDRIQRVQAQETIGTHEAPVQAVRQKRDSSLVKTITLLRRGDADAAISAGSTGALMAAGLFGLGRMAGIERPALSALLPSFHGWGVMMLDVGANLSPRATQLHQYGIMGSVYCREVYEITHPKVALLNVGVEAEKGTDTVKQAYQLLAGDGRLNFVGNVEPRELLSGQADVVVTDGFSGNVALKAIEGTARDIFREVRQALTSSWKSKMGALLVKDAFVRLGDRWDYQEAGGAPLLGLSHIVYKCHGSSDARAFLHTLLRAAEYCRRDSHTRLREYFQEGAEA